MSLTIQFGRSLLFLLLFLLLMGSPCTDTTSPTTAEQTSSPATPSTNRLDYSTTNNDNDDISSTSTLESFGTTTSLAIERYACPEGFTQLTIDWCFHLRFDSDLRMTFEDSQSYCEQKGAILPAITSVEVTTALMLERTATMGISPFEAFFIGLGCDTKNYRWQWIGGPAYDPGVAFFARSSTGCPLFFRLPFVFDQFGAWQYHDESALNPALIVCAMRPTGYSPSNPIEAPCTEMWTQLPGGYCYRLANLYTPVNIYDAEMQCRGLGGHLPAIMSSVQSDVILTYLIGKGHQNSQFWIGLYCTFADGSKDNESVGKRAWIDGTPFSLDYTNFLDPSDATDTCSISFVTPFLYNGLIYGKWQKERYNQTLDVLMCTRPDPEPIALTSTATATTTTTAKSTATTYVQTTTIITTIITTSVEPTTTSQKSEETGNHRRLSNLELILIISLVIIIVIVAVVLALYFLCQRIKKGKVQEIVASMQKRFSRSDGNVIHKTDEWEIRRQFLGIDYSRQLGRGAFGSVYLGRVFSDNIPDMAVKTLLQLNVLKKEDNFVAVKTLHETADQQAALEFREEINVMKRLGFHERLVNLLGCVTETEPLLLVVEYCSNGDLLGFMRERRMFMMKLKDTVGDEFSDRHSIITQRQQLMFGIEIAYGMEYLSQRGFVHRDIAARNILVDKNETCKIGDFGLCRAISGQSEQYISRGGRLPWRWMAPEALEQYHFSVESDVWSFGVLLFEIITLGGNPYPDWPAVELLSRLKRGERMEKPEGCSDGFYEIMLECWRDVPPSRLSFENIRRRLAHELEASSNDDYYLKLDAAAKYYQEAVETDKHIDLP